MHRPHWSPPAWPGTTARSLVLGVAILVLPACSAIVAPNVGRLGGDGAVPGTDGGVGCGPGLVSCGGTCRDPSTDPGACGGCGRTCGAGSTCVSGACVCASASCSPPGLGDPTDCGPSHLRCGAGRVCLDGACTCRPPLTEVAGACVDLGSDPTNCGAPGARCPDVCLAGACATGCGGALECDGACVDASRDPLNCGECGRVCAAGSACVRGDCRDTRPAEGCTGCPCATCGDLRCCLLPRLELPYCVEADACP